MSSALIPVPANHYDWIQQLFIVKEAFTLTKIEFDKYWPLVDGFWATDGTSNGMNWNSHYFTCRLRKPKTSSAKRSGDGIKRRESNLRKPRACPMRIKIIETKAQPPVFHIQQTKPEELQKHDHEIDLSWKEKTSTFLREIILRELEKGYSLAIVLKELKGSGHDGGRSLFNSIGGEFLDIKRVGNIKRVLGKEYKQNDVRKLEHGSSLESDWEKATTFLSDNSYLWETITATITTQSAKKDLNQRGLVFAHPERLEILANCGYLTLFDSSHKLNFFNYNLFSFLYRDEYGVWVPGAHCLVESEGSDILSAAIKKIKYWSNGRWQMVYALTDDSAVEQRGVRLALPAISSPDGHFRAHLLCTVHSERTLSRKFGALRYRKTFEKLHHAMFCRTQEHCINHIMAVIDSLPENDHDSTAYITKEWLDTRAQWAMWARQHSQILLQVTTTNPCEAWHQKIKGGQGQRKEDGKYHGIYGCVKNIDDCGQDVMVRVKKNIIESTTRASTLSIMYPLLTHFPFKIQKLIASEESEVSARLLQQKSVPQLEFTDGLPFCSCIFFLRYTLPCRHVFHLDRAEGLLTGEVWERFIDYFGERGMEVYEDRRPRERGQRQLEVVASGDDSGRMDRVLRMREVSEQIRATFYQLEDTSTDNSHGFLNEVEQWIQELTLTFSSYRDNHLQYLPLSSSSSTTPLLSSLHPTISISSFEDSDIQLPRPFLSVADFPSPAPSTAPSSYYSGSDVDEEHIASSMPESWDFSNPSLNLPGWSHILFPHSTNISE
ncbi:hypothetical protein HOY80DRAFT_1005215 [Tuber brumale]|nr:hypothetical protein HOY80DRAFT_1005215 [Tuber brumale]